MPPTPPTPLRLLPCPFCARAGGAADCPLCAGLGRVPPLVGRYVETFGDLRLKSATTRIDTREVDRLARGMGKVPSAPPRPAVPPPPPSNAQDAPTVRPPKLPPLPVVPRFGQWPLYVVAAAILAMAGYLWAHALFP